MTNDHSNAHANPSRWHQFANHRLHHFIALPIRWYLGYIFIAASIHKIAHPADFALDVATYQILPLVLVNLMAIILPWLEIITGIMLVIGLRVRAASLLICGMMITFIIALGIALHTGLNISCGCFASGALEASDPISWLTMLRDLAWLSLGIYIVIFDKCAIGIDAWLCKKWRHQSSDNP